MEKFKVICKIRDSKCWETVPRKTKVVTRSSFFGLIKSSMVVDDPNYVPGPSKDEICVVYEVYTYKGDLFYKLLGYPYGGYDSTKFIRLDEFEETSKEIARKADLQTN